MLKPMTFATSAAQAALVAIKQKIRGERKLRHNLETFLPCTKTVSGWLEHLSVRQQLLLSQEQLLLPRMVKRLELRLLE